jgi:tRNA pseudouridine32 synthase/23S rRNA pseudouridine746 synthase
MALTFAKYSPSIKPYLDILFEDKDILVVNKQSGLLSVAGKAEELRDCVEYRARMEFGWITAAHRLDMDTSGIMVLARNKPALANISQQFEKRQTTKTYIAVVYGLVVDDEGEVNLPIRCDWPNRPKQMVCLDKGRAALTRYKVLERSKNISGENISRIKFSPVTGRTHQLRVHAHAMGHPILGDPIYADGAAKSMATRLQLHATSLGLKHPVTGDELSFKNSSPF